MTLPPEHQVACQQVLLEDHSVFSVQWTTFPKESAGAVTSGFLFNRYLQFIRKSTLSVIRPAVVAAGVEFRLAGTRASLLSFAPALYEPGAVRLRIRGGLLVEPKQCDRGEIAFMVEEAEEGLRATIQLGDYCPIILGSRRSSIIRKWLYRWTQAYIHRVVTVGFLARISREILGPETCVKEVRVRVREGIEI